MVIENGATVEESLWRMLINIFSRVIFVIVIFKVLPDDIMRNYTITRWSRQSSWLYYKKKITKIVIIVLCQLFFFLLLHLLHLLKCGKRWHFALGTEMND